MAYLALRYPFDLLNMVLDCSNRIIDIHRFFHTTFLESNFSSVFFV